MRRYVEGSTVKLWKLNSDVKYGTRMMKRLPKLETLTLRVVDDIMSSDLEPIRSISKFQGKSKILLDIGTALVWDGDGGEEDRLIRISVAVVELFHECGWEPVGDFEKVDEQHEFGNEVLWVRWLDQNRRRGVQSGLQEAW